MIDSHCHLDSDELGRDPEVVAAEARAVGVSDIVMAGVDPSGWAAQRALAVRIPNVHTVFGIHPQMIPSYDCESLEAAYIALEAAITTARPVALGELGLDRLSDATKASIDVQGNAFREQLRMAKRFDLPIVLHLLRADEPALKILREEGVPAAGGVVHSFSGSAEYAQQLLKLGLHLSFAGTLTFEQSRRLREAARITPADRLLVETDSPFQPPAPHRGEANRPALLPLVVQALADVRGWSFEETANVTASNARRLFGLGSHSLR